MRPGPVEHIRVGGLRLGTEILSSFRNETRITMMLEVSKQSEELG